MRFAVRKDVANKLEFGEKYCSENNEKNKGAIFCLLIRLAPKNTQAFSSVSLFVRLRFSATEHHYSLDVSLFV